MDGCAVALLIDSDSYCRLESSTGPVSAKLCNYAGRMLLY